ncbi:hypothetical protein JW711_03140 [Candidatus Woesearchaeota archaeon]|nr:hypothetical protein [Candidatus Woesearchaeota archaeon]
MPHQCVRCGKLYSDGEIDILNGCKCGAKMFYFLKKEKYDRLMKEAEAPKAELNAEEREQVEHDVYDLLGEEIDKDKPVILDLECIEVLQPGKYNLDIVKLFQNHSPFVVKLEDGKYFVDLDENFERLSKDVKRK